MERCTALDKLVELRRNETLQRTRATRAEKASEMLQERIKKVTTKKNRLTARCDELALKHQYIAGATKKAKEPRKLCMEVERLMKKQAKDAFLSRTVRGETVKRAKTVTS